MLYINQETLVENQAGLDQLADLNKFSHKLFKVKCDFNQSKKCRQEYNMEFRQFVKLISNNNGKLPCIFCSRSIKFSGRSNPNTKYKSIDDNFFQNIDSAKKAYLLGWVASDGHIGKRGFKIKIHQKDKEILKLFANIISDEVPIKIINDNGYEMCSFEINSQKISNDLCNHLKIKPGKKSNTVAYPPLDKNLSLYFLRGYFEGDGCISNRLNTKCQYPVVGIYSDSIVMLNGIKKTLKNNKIVCNIYKNVLHFNAKESLKFLSYIYSDISDNLYLSRKYNIYIDWKNNYTYNALKREQ